MLTVPKLPQSSQRKNSHIQPALSYPFSTSSNPYQMDHTPDDFYIKSQIPIPNYNKGKQNLPLKKKEQLNQTLSYNHQHTNLKNKYQSYDPLSQISFLPQKNKDLQKKLFPFISNKSNQSTKDSFISTQTLSRQENQKVLQSLKMENEKYKKFIQQNQFLKKQHNYDFYTDYNSYTQRQKEFDFLPKSKQLSENFALNRPKKILEEMSNLTSSFIIDQNQSCINFSFDGRKKNPQKEEKFNIFDFEKIKFLGKGNFGEVNLVKHKKTNFLCAMKTIKKSFVKEENVQHQISRQIRIHLSLKHLNVISFYGFFDDSQNVYLLMEYATGGQLFKRLKDCYRMTEKDVIPIIKDTLDGLRMIHSLQYIHRDLKPENIIFQFGIAKICDMGWAADCSQNQMRKSFCGTPLYLPPEMIKKQQYDQSADIWSIGILTYELLVGKIPFNIWSDFDLHQIVDRQIVFPTNYVDMSENSIDFIKKCLNRDPHKRIKLDQLSKHEFLKNTENEGYFNVEVYEAIEKLFHWNNI